MELKQYQEAFEKLKAGRKNEPSWLLRLREEAMATFARRGFPTVKDDAWRYTDVTAIREAAFVPEGERIQSARRDRPLKGVEVLDIFEAVKAFPELLEKHLGRHAEYAKDPFTALNTGLFSGGTFIRISDGIILKEPIRIVHSSATDRKGLASQPRTIILLGKGSKASVVETYDAGGSHNASVCHPRKHLSGIQASPLSGFPLETCGNDRRLKGLQILMKPLLIIFRI